MGCELYTGFIDISGRIESVNTFENINTKFVHFVAQDENEQRLDAVLHAAKHALSITDTDLTCSQYKEDDSSFYTYMYFEKPSLPSLKTAFYVGKGNKRRWTEHIRKRLSKNCPVAKNRKESIIDSWIQKVTCSSASIPSVLLSKSENFLVRKVGQWTGIFADAQSFAMEYALIAGRIGVYNLSNKTGGNSKSNIHKLKLLARPTTLDLEIPQNAKLWAEAVKVFDTQQYAYLQSRLEPALRLCSAYKNVRELNSQMLKMGLIPYRRLQQKKEINHMPDNCAVDGSSDQSLYFRTEDERPFCVQLIFSHKDHGVRINLRPIRRHQSDFIQFEQFLKTVCLNETILPDYYSQKFVVKNLRQDPYFKPFARYCEGRNDCTFPLDDKEISVEPNWLPLHTKLNLSSAIKSLINGFK